ncbi:MAG TPA: TIGR04255 family protein [Spirochaetota bacterium]|nr:TIGR04255 family protein [Spirochaetota bacterium]
MGKDNIRYKNAPLVEAVFEVRFPGEPVVENRRDIFFEKIRDEYPNIHVPPIQPGSFPALEAYQYHNSDSSIIVMTALNRFSVSTKRYSGFSSFKNVILGLSKEFDNCYKLKKVNRIGLRYINIIPFIREDDIVPMNKFFNLSFNLPSSMSKEYSNLNLVLTSKLEAGLITIKIASMLSDNRKDEALLLDFDFAKEHELRFSDIEKHLEEGHLVTKKIFEELITDEYREYIKGDVV